MGGSFGSDGSAGSARAVERLVLRFWLPGRPYEEVYVDRRLFIGRVEGNDIQIPDEAVDRQHARVDFRGTDTEGQWVLECLRPDGFVEAEGRRHHRLVLQPGLRFTVGPCQFECLAVSKPVAPKPEQDWSVCPHCRSEQARRLAVGMGRCPACGGEVVVLQDGSGRPAVLPVEVLGCRLLRLIGQGGMAWVFEARLKDRADLVAVKILMPHLLADESALQRFQREIKVLQQIRHPRVLRRLGQGKWKGLPCLLTPLMPGSLRDVLEEHRRQHRLCDFRMALSFFLDVLEGLEVLHQAGLVHRDLKPSNVLLDAQGSAVVADLGIARRVASPTASLTATGTTVGTPQYMAPEQWDRPDSVDQRADQYALGVMFYELLTGKLPPRGPSWQRPSQLNPTVPKAFDGVIERLLADDPADRYPDLRALREDLQAKGLLSGLLAPATPPSPAFPTPPAAPVTTLPFMPLFGAVLPAARSSSAAPPSSGGAVPTGVSQTGRQLRRFEGHTSWVISVAFSPDGRQVLTGSGSILFSDGTARLWDAQTGRELRRFKGHTGWVLSVAFSPDGRQVLTGSVDKTARLWDAQTGHELRRFEGHTGSVESVAFSPDGRQVLTGSSDGTARLWDAQSGRLIAAFCLFQGGGWATLTSEAFVYDGQESTKAILLKCLRLVDPQTGQERPLAEADFDRFHRPDLVQKALRR